jgi:hypothetical protein
VATGNDSSEESSDLEKSSSSSKELCSENEEDGYSE